MKVSLWAHCIRSWKTSSCLITLFFGVLCSWGAPAFAESFRLDYQKEAHTDGCPDEALFRASLSSKLGKEALSPVAEKTLRIQVRRMNRQVLAATLKVFDESGQERGRRELSSKQADCQELTESLLLATALLVDPLFLSRKPAPLPSAPQIIRPVEPVEAPRPETPSPREIDPWQLGARLWVGGGLTSTPTWVPLGGLEAHVATQKVLLGLEWRGQLPAVATYGVGQVRSSVWIVSALPCLTQTVFDFCAVASLGSTSYESVNVVNAQAASTLWASAGVRGLLRMSAGPGDVVLLLELSKPFVTTRIRLEPVEIWKTPPLTGHLGLGYGWKF